MAAEHQNSPMEGVPCTPKIRDVTTESGSENCRFCSKQPCHVSGGELNPGIRRVSSRAEIDTSPPFGSVKEAVTRFGGSGPWVPLYKFAESYDGIEEFDLKKVEEQTAELEKNLIVKELETLDVLEELGTTKKIVEELKRQLQNEALKCMKSTTGPDLDSDAAIKEMNEEHYEQKMRIECPFPVVMSPDSILMELKQAKLNLGKTINDLGVIQASVECLNKKMNREKRLLERIRDRERLTYKPGQFKHMVDGTKRVHEHNKPCIRTGEMRWIAAKKMEEAAMAAKALAVLEMKGLLSSNEEANIGIASRRQLDAEEAIRAWNPEQEQRKHVVYNAANINNSPLYHPHDGRVPRSPLDDPNKRNTTTVSMGDILSRKQVHSTKVQSNERQKIALSQMLQELRQDHHLVFSPKPDKKDEQKQNIMSQRRKFGFIHISLPLPKHNKKKSQALNTM